MKEDILLPEEEMDDDAFLASLEDLLREPADEPGPEDKAAEPPEPASESEASEKTKEKPGRHAKEPRTAPQWLKPLLCGAAALCVVILAVFGVLTLRDPYRRKILPGVSVGTVELSGMSRYQAKKALDEAYRLPLSRQNLVVTFPEDPARIPALEISSRESGAHVDTAGAVKAAYAVGRTADTENRTLPLSDFLTLNEAMLRELTADFAEGLRRQTQAHTAYLEGSTPDVTDPNAVPQVLVITPSQPAPSIDGDVLYEDVVGALREGRLEALYSGPMGQTVPELADLQAIYDENCFAPQEPTIDKKTLEVTPGKPGYVFDVGRAREQMLHQGAEELRIPLEIVQPTISDQDVYFQDVLGHCETPHGDNEKRNTNLRLACASLDGLVLQPGQEFSYNDTLGERTKEKGYMPAPAYSGTTLVDSLGGGICQVSSTLYLASLYAELTVLERVNHGFPVHYIPYGMDATVNWGFTDLKLRNDSPLPVKIHAEESDGYVRIDILGTETRDYDIEMSYSVGGRHVKTFMTKKDKATGEVLSKDFVALSSYMEDVFQ